MRGKEGACHSGHYAPWRMDYAQVNLDGARPRRRISRAALRSPSADLSSALSLSLVQTVFMGVFVRRAVQSSRILQVQPRNPGEMSNRKVQRAVEPAAPPACRICRRDCRVCVHTGTVETTDSDRAPQTRRARDQRQSVSSQTVRVQSQLSQSTAVHSYTDCTPQSAVSDADY